MLSSDDSRLIQNSSDGTHIAKKARTGSEGTEVSEKASSTSDLGEGAHSQSPGSSDLKIDTSLNQRLIVNIHEVTDEYGNKQIELAIADRRPPTHLGSDKQGDHVTAYIAYLHMLITAVDGESIQKAANIITEAAKAILPDKATVFDELITSLQPLMSTVISRDSRHAIIASLKAGTIPPGEIVKANEALKRDKRSVFMNATKQICQKFLEEVNLDEEIAFARAGDQVSGAGAKEKKAIHTLKAINELEAIDLRAAPKDQEDQFDRLYSSCIKTSAPYIMGINNVLGSEPVRGLRARCDNLKALDRDQAYLATAKTQLLGELSALYSHVMNTEEGITAHTGYTSSSKEIAPSQPTAKIDLISKCFGDLFDFKYKTHQQKVVDDPELLYRVIARHIVCMFRAFDKLQAYDKNMKDQIIDKFLSEAILGEQGWTKHGSVLVGKLVKLDVDIIKKSIGEYLDLDANKMLTRATRDSGAATVSQVFRGLV